MPSAGDGRDIDRFLGDPTRDLGDWRWLWSEDREFPVRSHRALAGRLVVFLKRLLKPVAKTAQSELWERQRVFNLILLEHLEGTRDARQELRDSGIRQGKTLDEHHQRLERLEAFFREGLEEVMRHNDALFSRVDQKLDADRRQTRDLWGGLAAALARVEQARASGGVGAPAGGDAALDSLLRLREESLYLELERRYRGTEAEIEERIQPYLERLRGRGAVLDLGCGRGEALQVLSAAGVPARGVDASEEMVASCRGKGLDAERADLFEALLECDPESLGGVVSFHVIEHLPPSAVDRLVRLAWRVLRPGGVLILETPNPLSLVVAARNFWLDPTHLRPVHPETLALLCRSAGFDTVERLDLRPFGEAARLPELVLDGLSPELRELADQVNRLRDRLDEILFGYQDYAVVASRS